MSIGELALKVRSKVLIGQARLTAKSWDLGHPEYQFLWENVPSEFRSVIFLFLCLHKDIFDHFSEMSHRKIRCSWLPDSSYRLTSWLNCRRNHKLFPSISENQYQRNWSTRFLVKTHISLHLYILGSLKFISGYKCRNSQQIELTFRINEISLKIFIFF